MRKIKEKIVSILLALSIIFNVSPMVLAEKNKAVDDTAIIKQINSVEPIVSGCNIIANQGELIEKFDKLLEGTYQEDTFDKIGREDFYFNSRMLLGVNFSVHKYVKLKKIDENKTEISLRFNTILGKSKLGYSNAVLMDGNNEIQPSKKHMADAYAYKTIPKTGEDGKPIVEPGTASKDGEKFKVIDQATYTIDKPIDQIKDLKLKFEISSTDEIKNMYNDALENGNDSTEKLKKLFEKEAKLGILHLLYGTEVSKLTAEKKKEKSGALTEEEKKEINRTAYDKAYKELKNKTNEEIEKEINNEAVKRSNRNGGLENYGFIKDDNKLHILYDYKLDSSWKMDEKTFNTPEKVKDVVLGLINYGNSIDTVTEELYDNAKADQSAEDVTDSLDNALEFSMADSHGTGQGGCFIRCGQVIKRGDKYFLKVKADKYFTASGLNGALNFVGSESNISSADLPYVGCLASTIARKKYVNSNKVKEDILNDGYSVYTCFEGLVYDEIEFELLPLKDGVVCENPIIYDKDCKRWAIALSVCVDAMGDYTPMCHIYMSDMDNFEGFNYRNYMIYDNFRRNLYKNFDVQHGDKLDKFKKNTDIFTGESINNILKLDEMKLYRQTFPAQSYEETEKLMKACKEKIKETLKRKDGKPVTDQDIAFMDYNMDKVKAYPEESPFEPIDANMSNSTTELSGEEPQEEEASVDSVTIKDKDIQIEKGKSYRLEADVAGKNLKVEDKKVDWNLVGSYDKDTTIDKDGNLKVSKSEEAEKIKVKATSKKDSSKSDQVDLVIKKSTVIPTPSKDLTKYDENNNNVAAKPIYEEIDSAYEIPVSLINHVDKNRPSMAEDALINDKKMIVTEKGGIKKAYLVFDKRTVLGGIEGRLTKLFSLKDNKIESKNKNDILCDILSYKKGKQLGQGSEKLFPHVFSLAYTDFKEGENTIYLRVNVDAMDTAGEGSGQKIVDLKFNTNSKQDLTIDSLKKKFEKFNHPKHMKIVSKDKKTFVSLANVDDNAKLNVGISTSKDNEKLKEVSEKIKNLAELKDKEISKLIHTSIPKDTSIGSEPIFTYQVDCKDLKNPKPYFVDGNKLENIQGARIVGNTLIFGLSKLGDAIITSDAKSPNPPEPNPPAPDPQNPAKVKSVKIEQENIKAKAGKTYKLTAKVEGESLSDEDKAVDWSISGNELTATSIDKNGNLSISAKESSTRLKVKATSKKDPSKSDEVSVSIDKVEEADKDLAYYEVPVRLMHVGKTEYADNTPSMGDNAIIKTAIVKVEKVKPTYQIKFKGLDFMNLHGHVTKLFVFDEKVTKGSNMTPDSNGKKTEMKVLKHIEDESLIKGLRKKFPEIFEFSRGEKEDEIYVRVNVDAMDSLSSVGKSGKLGDIHSYDEIKQGAGAQSAILRFDWSKARKTDKSNFIGSKDDKDEKVEVKGRLSGYDRYETSVEISKAYFKKADKVVLASGMNDADALVAASYADLSKSPILLTKIKDLPSKTLSEIERLNASEVVIVGGKASVSSSVEKKLKEKGLAVSRVSGSDRYATSIDLAKKVVKNSSCGKLVLINGRKNADALTVSSLATSESLPVVMTDGNNVSKSVKKFVKDNDINEVIIVGGNSSMNARMMKQLDVKTRRIAGKDRFETAIKIADEVYPYLEKVILANGYNSIDALSAGAITNIAKAPIILINKNSIPSSVKSRLKDLDEDGIIVVGGKNTITNSVYNKLIN